MDFKRMAGEAAYLVCLMMHEKGPMRFRDMNKAVRSRSTLAGALRQLQGMGLVKTISGHERLRPVTRYALTTKGQKMVEHMEALKRL